MMNATMPLVKKYIERPWKIKLFLYVNAETMEPSDTVRRIKWCREHECLPYVMRDANCYGSEYEHFYTDLAAWGNQPGMFKKMAFNEFLRRRHPNNIRRQGESWAIWNDEMPTLCESCWQPAIDLFQDDTNNIVCESCLR